jgi:predicted esterase YcpF (UPF0227 family)
MIVYLHGFNSSPQSFKARLIGERMQALGLADRFAAPALSTHPAEAIAQAEAAITAAVAGGTAVAAVTLVGSSLGGFYATWLAERHGCRAALVNPAVAAHRLLAGHVGRQRNLHTGDAYDFTEADVDALRGLDVARITRPERYLLLATTGDEVLDYRDAVVQYAGAEQVIVDGGDHGFTGFDRYVDRVLAFAGI